MEDKIKIDVQDAPAGRRVTTPEELSGIGRGKFKEIQEKPLQLPGRPDLLRKERIAGPDSKLDVRFYIDAETLEALLDAAKHSVTNRAVVHMAGIEVSTWRDKNTGHMYQTLRLTGKSPAPEDPLIVRALTNQSGSL